MGAQQALTPLSGLAGLCLGCAGLAGRGLQIGLTGGQQGAGAGGAWAVLPGCLAGVLILCSLCGCCWCVGLG